MRILIFGFIVGLSFCRETLYQYNAESGGSISIPGTLKSFLIHEQRIVYEVKKCWTFYSSDVYSQESAINDPSLSAIWYQERYVHQGSTNIRQIFYQNPKEVGVVCELSASTLELLILREDTQQDLSLHDWHPVDDILVNISISNFELPQDDSFLVWSKDTILVTPSIQNKMYPNLLKLTQASSDSKASILVPWEVRTSELFWKNILQVEEQEVYLEALSTVSSISCDGVQIRKDSNLIWAGCYMGQTFDYTLNFKVKKDSDFSFNLLIETQSMQENLDMLQVQNNCVRSTPYTANCYSVTGVDNYIVDNCYCVGLNSNDTCTNFQVALHIEIVTLCCDAICKSYPIAASYTALNYHVVIEKVSWFWLPLVISVCIIILSLCFFAYPLWIKLCPFLIVCYTKTHHSLSEIHFNQIRKKAEELKI